MLGYRSSDAVITICQNNAWKSIEIVDANDAATALIGYTTAELAGRQLSQLIPERLATLMNEYVEYEEDANDVGTVLSKIQSFGFLSKDRKEKSFRLKVVRGESTKDKMTFRLVLQDAIDLRKDDALHKLIQENFKGHEVQHPVYGVPDRKSLEKDMELVTYYHHKAQLRASFVLVKLDHVDAFEKQYGHEQCVEFVKHLLKICRGNLRPSDMIGAVSDTELGIILFDSISDSTRMVANRLRWQIAAGPYILNKAPLSLSASMVYINIDGLVAHDKIIEACEAQLADIPEGAAGHLAKVGT
jgi:diguanylate cyclase (GGDEF)-like protein/PAS domain S-box-containing protein